MDNLDGGAKILYDYTRTLVSDGLLQEGSVTDYDCQFIWNKAIEEEQKMRTKEFAI